MAANNEDVISSFIDQASVGKEGTAFIKLLDEIYAKYKQINATKISLEGSKSFEQVAAAVKKLKTEEDELQKIASQVEATYKKRMALESQQAKLLSEEKELLRQRNQELKNQVREENAAEGSIEKLRATIIRLNKEYDNLSKAERDAGKGTDLLASIKSVSTELKGLEGETGRFQRNVGNYGNAFKGALSVLENELTNIKDQMNDPALGGKQLESLRNQEQLLSDVLSGVSANFSSTRAEARAFQEAAAKIGLTLGQDSEAFQAFRQEVGAANDDIKDIKDSIKLAASDTQGFDRLIGAAQGLTGAFSVAQGAAALLGSDSKELEATFVKLQAAMTILNGLQAIQNELKNKDSIFRKIVNTLIGSETKLTNVQTVAQEANAVATNTATTATKGFGVALKGLGIGLLLSLLPLISSAMEFFGKSAGTAGSKLSEADEKAIALKDSLSEMGTTASEIADGVISKLDDSIKSLNDELGLTPSVVDQARGALELLQKEQKDIVSGINLGSVFLGGISNAYGGQFAALGENLEKIKALRDKTSQFLSKKYENDLQDAGEKAAEQAKKDTEKEKQDGIKRAEDRDKLRKDNLAKEIAATFQLKQLYAQQSADVFKRVADNPDGEYKSRIVAARYYATQQESIIKAAAENEIATNKLTGNQAALARAKAKDEIVKLERETELQVTKIYTDEANARLKAEEDAKDKANADNQAQLDEIQKLADAENEIIAKQIQQKTALLEAQNNADKERETKLAEYKKQLYTEVFDFIQGIVISGFEKQKNAVQAQIDIVDKQKETEIAAANASASSQQEKADKIAVINATSQAKKDALERQQREIEVKKAKAEKAFSILRIAIATIQKVAEIKATAALLLANPLTAPYAAVSLAQIPFVIASGAISAAAILATPIPKYRTGRSGGKAELAIVGDGGREEIIQHPDGTAFKTPAKDTLAYLPEGAKVYPSIQDFIDNYARNAISQSMKSVSNHVTEHNFQMVYMQRMDENIASLSTELDAIKNAIENKPVANITNTHWGLQVQQEKSDGWIKYINKYFKD